MKKVVIVALILALCLTAAFGLAACNNAKDWKYIEKNGKMIIGYTVFNPMNYTENSEFVGFDTELAKAVCEELGVQPVFQEIDWDNKFVELQGKQIDCIWNGFTVTEERKAQTDFSVSYLLNKQIAVVKSENAAKYSTLEKMAQENARFTAEIESAGEGAILANAAIAGNYTAMDSQINALLEVLAGRSDVAVVDSVMAEGTLRGASYEGLTIVEGIALTEEEYAIGFRTGSPETVAKVNAALKKLYDNGTIAALAAKYNLTESLLPIE